MLLSGDSTLPNGIRIYEFSDAGSGTNSFDLIAGYRTGVHSEIMNAGGLSDVVAAFLKSTESLRAIEVAAYGSGGTIEFFSDLNRTGIRLKMPNWARPMVADSIAEFLSETPQKHPELVDRALDEVRSGSSSTGDVPSGVEEQFRLAMMGAGAKSDLSGVTRETVNEFFAKNYGTNRAFVVMNSAPVKALQSVERRISEDPVEKGESPLKQAMPGPASSSLHVQSNLDEGAVIWGVPTPSIYYRNWYALLMLDRLIQKTVSLKPRTELRLSLDPYYYRMQVSVPSGQVPEAVEAALRQRLDQMQYVRVSNEDLEVARRSALQYLANESVQGWFLSLGLPERRLEGMDWVRSFSADDMRTAARDLLEASPVVASWAPRIRTLRLDAEKLSDIAERAANPLAPAGPKPAALGPVRVTPFPPHTDTAFFMQSPLRLDSGVSIVASSSYAVFVAPDSPNSLTFYGQEPDSDLIQTSYGVYRSSRILVMAPPEAMDRVKKQWEGFKGNSNDETPVKINGNIPGPHIPALLVLKMLLDRRLIEAGMWSNTRLEICVSEGSTLSFHGSESDHRLVLSWIADIASRPIPEEEFDWAREAAIHHLPDFLPDLQSLLWEWFPEGTIPDIHLVPAALIKDVARIYLQ
jgi:hypothetical protein